MAPEVMHRLGDCGGPVPGGLPLLPILADPDHLGLNVADACPVAMSMEDPDIRHWMDLVTSQHGRGLLDGLTDLELPPFYRSLRDIAANWHHAWRMMQVTRG